jgi:hypothetical protein
LKIEKTQIELKAQKVVCLYVCVCVLGGGAVAKTAGEYFLLKIPLYHQVGSYDYTLQPVK